jgi:predicted amidophosphoribosyltransferase
MAVQTIGTCPGCGSWASLRGGLCPTCAAHGRVLTVPIGLLSSGLPIQARVLASAGFSAARIAELLAADEADVRRVLG